MVHNFTKVVNKRPDYRIIQVLLGLHGEPVHFTEYGGFHISGILVVHKHNYENVFGMEKSVRNIIDSRFQHGITTSKSFNPFNKQQSLGNHIYAPNSLLVRYNNRVLTCHSLEGIYSFLLKMQNVFIWNTVLLSPLFHTSEGAK